MSERKSFYLLIAIMITSCLFIAGTTITILYKTGIKEERARLMETAQSQARLIESIARFDRSYSTDYPGGAKSATLKQIIDAHDNYTGFGKTGEFTLSEKEGKNIVFLLRHRHSSHSTPNPVPYESELAEPMRRALSGRSGTVVGLDYRGEKVLAAYEPVAELNLGIVAKIDMSEVRSPFFKAGLIVMFITFMVVLVGVGLFFWITNPMIIQLEKRTYEMKKLNDQMTGEIHERKRAEAALRKSERELKIRNRISEVMLTIPDNEMFGEVLAVVLEAMKSKYGTFGYIDEDGSLVVPSMTREIWDECKIPEKGIVFPREIWGDSIWGRCLTEKKSISSNGPFQVPHGHIPITRALAVPIVHRGDAIGNFLIGNKLSDYDDIDRELMEHIADFTAPVLKARIERDRQERKRRQAEEELKKAHDEMELRVDERTAELMKTNEALNREIKERGLAEDALRRSEENYRLLIKALPAVVYKGYPDWRVEFVDKKVEELTGYATDKFNSGRSKWSDIIVEEDLESVKESFIHALKTEKVYTREYRIKEISGEIKWIQDRGHIVCNTLGAAEYISGVFFDITDRKRQEAEFQKTQNLLQTVFDGIPDPLILLDENLKMKIINRAAMHYYQIEKLEDISGICCYEALRGKSAPCKRCNVPVMIAKGKSGSFERLGITNPNKLEQVNVYIFDEKGHGFGGALMRIHDITESRLLEREMAHNEKLSSLGLTISCITHEMANPISAIVFNAPILKDYINAMIPIVDEYSKGVQDLELFQMPFPQFRKDVFKIITNILHASKRINSILLDMRKLYGKQKQYKKDWCDLKQLVERIIPMVGVEIGQRVKFFEINIPENLPKIQTDPDAIEQILINLLTNAAQAADKEDSLIKLEVTQGNTWENHLIIEVSDNGCGMDQETLAKIFNPFFTTKLPGQGTGLGLYVCQDLVKDLEGRIEVQSEPGNGSVFRVVFPDIERRSARRL